MNAELKSYIKECNCPEIQNGWKPKVGDKIADNFPPLSDKWEITVVDKELKKGLVIQNVIFLPSLEQLIAMIGKRFYGINHEGVWSCAINDKNTWGATEYDGSTPELACIRAYKEIKREKK